MTIPDHLALENILPRLPVKSLIRFKSVCKNWQFSISSSKFKKSHFQFSLSRPQLLLHDNLDERSCCFLLPYDEHETLKGLVRVDYDYLYGEPKKHWRKNIVVVGCCNGLLCLKVTFDNDNCITLWNPATHARRKIACPSDCLARNAFLRFGCVSYGDDYWIVGWFHLRERTSEFYSFLLSTGIWKRYDECRPMLRGLGGDEYIMLNMVLLDDTVYFPIRRREKTDLSMQIVRLDLMTEQMTVMLIDVSPAWYRFSSLKGSLMLRCHSGTGHDVLLLKQNGDIANKYSWETYMSVPNHHGRFRTKVSQVLFTATKCLIVLGELIKVIEPGQEGTLETSRGTTISIDYISTAVDYVESFISPFLNVDYNHDEEVDREV